MFMKSQYGATLDQLIEVCSKSAMDEKRRILEDKKHMKRRKASKGFNSGRRTH
jgi:hypothetical protein